MNCDAENKSTEKAIMQKDIHLQNNQTKEITEKGQISFQSTHAEFQTSKMESIHPPVIITLYNIIGVSGRKSISAASAASGGARELLKDKRLGSEVLTDRLHPSAISALTVQERGIADFLIGLAVWTIELKTYIEREERTKERTERVSKGAKRKTSRVVYDRVTT